MNATPRRRSREKLFKAFYCFSGSDADHGVVRTVAKYKPPASSVNNRADSSNSRSESVSPPSYEPEQVQDTAVALLSLPDGLQRQHLKPEAPQSELFHTFVITQETGNRLFGSALRVWEQFACNEHKQLESDELQCFQIKALCLMTAVPLVMASKRILHHIWINNCSIELIQLICSIPTPAESRFLRLRLPQLARRRSSSTCSSNLNENRSNDLIVSNQSELLIYGGLPSLPVFDYSLRYLFTDLLSPNQFVRLFAAVLLEQRILITSRYHLPLMLVAESLSNLLQPFSWQHVYVPILPSRLGLHYLDAPTPYIMGIVLANSDLLNLTNDPDHTSPISSAHYRLDCDTKQLHIQPQIPSELDVLMNGQNDSNNDSNFQTEDKRGKDDIPLPPFLVELCALLKKALIEWKPSCNCLPPASNHWNQLQESQLDQRKPSIENLNDSLWNNPHGSISSDCAHLLEEQKFNYEIRSIVYRHLKRHLLYQHERYIQFSRPDTVKFDAVSFLCDQPASDRPFLTRFVQTQMFASMLDESGRKLQNQLCEQNLQSLTNNKDNALFIVDTDELVDDLTAPPLDSDYLVQAFNEAKLLDLRALADNQTNLTLTNEVNHTPHHSRFRHNGLVGTQSYHQTSSPFKVCMSPIRSKGKLIKTDSEPIQGPADAFAAQTHCRVINSLLKEAKMKTKRIVMDCMKDEKKSPSDTHFSIEQEEQNAQVAALCDLIQRIWSHGRSSESSQARCPLWHHLTSYVHSCNQAHLLDCTKPIIKNHHKSKENVNKPESHTAFGWMKKQLEFNNPHNLSRSPLASPIRAFLRNSTGSSVNGDLENGTKNDLANNHLPETPSVSLQYDVSSIQSLAEINTDVGRSRAFIRLCLQRRLLSIHLRTLLCDRLLLTRFYQKHAFLRSEDEREQFLTYLLTLTTVRLRSFSALYGHCSLRHRLYVHASAPFAGQVQILLHPPNSPINLTFSCPPRVQHIFQAKSLVHPICMWLQVMPQIKCFIHTVFLINEITGQSYKFDCGHWFGKSIEDGSIERLLIAEPISPKTIPDLIQKNEASRGYSIGRHWTRLWTSEALPNADQLPDLLGRAVNLLCRACLTSRNASKQILSSDSFNKTNYSDLDNNSNEHTPVFSDQMYELLSNQPLFDILFGDQQILATFSAALHDGFRCKTSRYSFRPSEHLWDMLVKLQSETNLSNQSFTLILNLIAKISEQVTTLSKEDRVRLLILISLRDQLLFQLFDAVLKSKFLTLYYTSTAFLRQPSSAHFLTQVLSPLIDIHLQLPPEITKGI